jgi:hypothetical protein
MTEEEEEGTAVVTDCELEDADVAVVAVEAKNEKKDMSKKRNCLCFLRQNFQISLYLIFSFRFKKIFIFYFPQISANCHLVSVKMPIGKITKIDGLLLLI